MDVEAIKKIALLAVLKPDKDATVRRLYRWFSNKFNVPITEVDQIPLEEIMLHYFEDKYEDLEPEQLQAEITFLSKTPEERAKETDAINAADEAFLKEAEEEAKSGITLKDKLKKLIKSLKQMDEMPVEKKVLNDGSTEIVFNDEDFK